MKSHNILIHKGFSLTEILIVIGLFILLGSIGLVVGFDTYRGDSFRSEKNSLVSVLQKARSRAVANVSEMEYGVHFEPGKYEIFQGTDYATTPEKEEILSGRHVNVTSGGSDTFDIIFDQITGSSITGDETIDLSFEGRSTAININQQGRIDY